MNTPPGDCYTLKDIQVMVKEGMQNDMFMKAYKGDAMQTLIDSWETKTTDSRSSNTAAYADASSASRSGS